MAVEKESHNIIREAKVLDVQRPVNVYYILLDSYMREDTLKNLLNYDNSDFSRFLMKNNYSNANETIAAYPSTKYSMVSIFEMEYFNKPLKLNWKIFIVADMT